MRLRSIPFLHFSIGSRIGLFAFLCPCDSVLVYEAPDGRMWIPHGAGYVVG